MSTPEHKVPDNYTDRTVCILGLGFVGLTLATVMADVGFNVIGIEIREEVFSQLKSADPHFFEPGLSDHLKRVVANGRLKVFRTIPENCSATVYIITVGTPLDTNSQMNLSSIQKICTDIAANLKDGDMVVLRSTVKLGTTRSIVQPILEKSHKKFHLAFCPERTIEGQAISELRYLPQVIGADNMMTSMRATQLFRFLTPTIVCVSDIETAEMIKLIDNTRRDVLFAFSNEVARLCDSIGISASEVISSGRFGYSRTDLPMPGPVGGPCLSKDPHILAQSMGDYGITPEITLAARKVNEEQPNEVVTFLKTYLKTLPNFPRKPKISLLGIAFKGQPATDDIRGTTAQPIFMALKNHFPEAEFWGYDPVVDLKTIEDFGLCPKASIQEALKGANLVLILNNHSQFSGISLERLSVSMARPAVIYDFWNLFPRGTIRLPLGIQYISLGSHKRPIIGKESEIIEYA